MTRPIRVLLVEDNPGDADLMRETLESSTQAYDIAVAVDGEEAIDYVLRRGRHAGAARPDLILLDLNLPRLDGAEVLAEIKRHDALRAIPIVVFTSSDAEQDILESYQRGANGYVTKVGDLGGFVAKIQAIEQFWFRLVTLP